MDVYAADDGCVGCSEPESVVVNESLAAIIRDFYNRDDAVLLSLAEVDRMLQEIDRSENEIDIRRIDRTLEDLGAKAFLTTDMGLPRYSSCSMTYTNARSIKDCVTS